MFSQILFLLACLSLALNLVRIQGLSIPDITFMAAFVFAVFEGLLIKKKTMRDLFPAHPLVLPGFLILVGGLISSFHAVSVSSSISITIKEFYIFVIFTPLVMYFSRSGNPERIVTALILSGLITSAASMYDYSVGYKFSNEMLMRLGSAPLKESWDRYSGLLGHPNEQAMFLSVVFPLSFSRLLMSFNKRFIDTLGHSLILAILGISLFLTGSVSGYLSVLISSAVCVLLFAYTVIKTKQLMKNLVSRFLLGSMALLVFLTVTVNTELGSRFLQSEFFRQSPASDYLSRSFDRVVTITAVSRWEDYLLGFQYIASDPLIGAGMDQSGTGGLDSSQRITSLAIHNTILQGWVAGGLLTFLGTIFIYLHVVNISLRALTISFSSKAYSILVGLAASSLGFVFMDMTSSNIYQRVKWLVFALLMGLFLVPKEDKPSLLSNSSENL